MQQVPSSMTFLFPTYLWVFLCINKYRLLISAMAEVQMLRTNTEGFIRFCFLTKMIWLRSILKWNMQVGYGSYYEFAKSNFILSYTLNLNSISIYIYIFCPFFIFWNIIFPVWPLGCHAAYNLIFKSLLLDMVLL